MHTYMHSYISINYTIHTYILYIIHIYTKIHRYMQYILTYIHTYIHTYIPIDTYKSHITNLIFQLKHPEIMIAKVLETKKGSGKAFSSSDFDDDASVKSNLT